MPPICKALLKICTVHLTPVCGRYLCVAGMDTLDRDRIHDFSRGTIHIYDLHQHVGDGLLRLRSGSAKQSVPTLVQVCARYTCTKQSHLYHANSQCPVPLYHCNDTCTIAKSLVPCKVTVVSTFQNICLHSGCTNMVRRDH